MVFLISSLSVSAPTTAAAVTGIDATFSTAAGTVITANATMPAASAATATATNGGDHLNTQRHALPPILLSLLREVGLCERRSEVGEVAKNETAVGGIGALGARNRKRRELVHERVLRPEHQSEAHGRIADERQLHMQRDPITSLVRGKARRGMAMRGDATRGECESRREGKHKLIT